MNESTDKSRVSEQEVDRQGDQSGDPQRGGRTPRADDKGGDEPRPADESAHDAIPSRSFNL